METGEAEGVVQTREVASQSHVYKLGNFLDECHGSYVPISTHLLCEFHILKNVGMKCKEHVEYNRKEHLMNLWNKFMYSDNEYEFEQKLKHFQVVCVDIPLFVVYVYKTWLKPYKEKFVVV